MPGRFGLVRFELAAPGEGILRMRGRRMFCSLNPSEENFRDCLGGGNFNEVTAILEDLSRKA